MSINPPNILLITTDQHRFDALGAMGNPILRTPVLDRLATTGTLFTRCYSPSPVCVPARAALITGLPPHLNGLTDNDKAVSFKRPPSLMERLREAGYQTQGTGKMHFVPDRQVMWGFDGRDRSEEDGLRLEDDDYLQFLHKNGYEHVHDPHGVRSEYYYIPQPSQVPDRLHHTRWIADRSLDFLQRRDTKRPFFLWASFIKPHPPFESPTPWNKLYRAAEMPRSFLPDGYEDLLTYWNHVQNRYKYRDAGRDELLLRTMRAAYYASISYIDYQVGRILEGLGDAARNTVIVFTADHGELLGDYGSFGKRCMLDIAARVPLIIRWPDQPANGKRCERPASLTDIFPTCLAAAGIENPAACDETVNLLDLATGRSDRDVAYSQFQERGCGLFMAASATAKYVWSEADQREWCFDLVNDPRETRDVPGHEPGLGLKEQLLARFRSDGYETPLSERGWRTYPKRKIPSDPDFGLLYQDHEFLQRDIDALGPAYARPVTDPECKSHVLLQPHMHPPFT